jgi:hypothetical protein
VKASIAEDYLEVEKLLACRRDVFNVGAIVTVALGERTPVAQQKAIYKLLRATNIGLTLSAVDNVGYGFRQEVVMYPGKSRNPTVSPRTAHIFSDMDSPFGEMACWMIENHPASPIVNKTV